MTSTISALLAADLRDPASAELVGEHLIEVANQLFNDEGEIAIPVYLLALTASPETGEPLVEPFVRRYLPTRENALLHNLHPRAYAEAMRGAARAGRAVCAGFLAETWRVPDEDESAWMGRFDEHPGRWTEVIVVVEHARRVGDLVWCISVKGREGGPRMLGEVERLVKSQQVLGLLGDLT